MEYRVYASHNGSSMSRRTIATTSDYVEATRIADREFNNTSCKLVEVGQVNPNSCLVECIYSRQKP